MQLGDFYSHADGRNAHDRMMQDFGAGILSPEEFAAKWDTSKRQYLYHGTEAKNLASIRQNGLVPRKLFHDIEPVWLGKEPEISDHYGVTILRIPKSAVVISNDYGSSCSTFIPISPEYIEVEKSDGSWERL